jgi:hypothetical protein
MSQAKEEVQWISTMRATRQSFKQGVTWMIAGDTSWVEVSKD